MKMAVFRVAPCRLMMEAASTSETSVNFYQSTRRNNAEDSYLQPKMHFVANFKVRNRILNCRNEGSTKGDAPDACETVFRGGAQRKLVRFKAKRTGV
jgi:ABC-type Fe3+/spermidine/putrescine transport system ATPase subunit